MSQNCYSCGVPLTMPEFKGPAEDYCNNCADGDGKLKPYEEVRLGLAQWLKSWQPALDDAVALKRATFYLKAMPAWAE